MTTLEQVKSLENIIASGEIKLDEAYQLQELYINKLRRGICVLEINVNDFLEESKSHIYLKTEIKGYYIREETKDNTIRIIYDQSKALKGHVEKLKENFNYALKEAKNEKMSRKAEKDQVINSREQMGKTILKLATLKIYDGFNIQWLREEHGTAMNAAKDNGTTETIE